jgi:hypothetical protein
MKIIISESQKSRLYSIIQTLINSELNKIREESEDWGLGEMDELDEVESVNRIEVNNIVTVDGIKVYVDIYKNSSRKNFQNIRSELQYNIQDVIPNIKIFINDIIDERTFGPGINFEMNINKTNVISELDRNWMDSEYEEQYERIKSGIIRSVKKMMKSYNENDDRINIYGENKKRLISYNKKSRELYYDRYISDIMENTLPHPIWYVNGKYIMSEVFESFFPDKIVKSCYSANMT